MGAGETEALQAVLASDLRPHHAPVADGVRAVGDLLPGDRDMQDERFDVLDAHGVHDTTKSPRR